MALPLSPVPLSRDAGLHHGLEREMHFGRLGSHCSFAFDISSACMMLPLARA
jgi:hypothetical protein